MTLLKNQHRQPIKVTLLPAARKILEGEAKRLNTSISRIIEFLALDLALQKSHVEVRRRQEAKP